MVNGSQIRSTSALLSMLKYVQTMAVSIASSRWNRSGDGQNNPDRDA